MIYRLEVWQKGSDGKMARLWRRRYRGLEGACDAARKALGQGLEVCFVTRRRPPRRAETLIWGKP